VEGNSDASFPFMICIVDNESEDINLEAGEVVFVCQCDDGRLLLISGEYCERFELPDIICRIGTQLQNIPVIPNYQL
jgi:hypothetical protein